MPAVVLGCVWDLGMVAAGSISGTLRWGVWIGDRASKSAMGNSIPFLFSSSYMCTTPVRSGLLLKASAHAWEERGRPVRKYKWSFQPL